MIGSLLEKEQQQGEEMVEGGGEESREEGGGQFTRSPSREREDKAACLLTLPACHAPIHSQQSHWHRVTQ